MYKNVILLALCAVALAVPAHRERRQANSCLDAFKNVPNPCQSNPQNLVYFPHPTDVTKFIQCDRYQRMYIIQCPGNLIYSVTTSTCRQQAVTVPPQPATNVPVVVPVTNVPVPSGTNTGSTYNPCTPSALAAGQIYFAVPNDDTKFIECDMLGHANILPCSTGLVWNESRLSCVYRFDGTGSGTVTTAPGTGTGTGTGTGSVTTAPGTSGSGQVDTSKLCTQANIQANKLFFAHPDPTKFIQCDLWGDAFVVSCPAGLIWNTYSETCASAYLTVNGAGK